MLEARGLDLVRGGRPVLCDVTLALAPGEVLAVIGPNGAGKSSLLACLSGALRPTAGTVALDGADPGGLTAPALARRRAVLDQAPRAAAETSVRALVDLAIPPDTPPGAAAALADGALAAMGLGALARRPLGALSGGERARAHLARALGQLAAGRRAGFGRYLLLDEPTASLDLAHQAAVRRAARRAAAEGAGVLVVLHDLLLAQSMADRVALLHQGRLVALGTTARVLDAAVLGPVYGVPFAPHRAADGVARLLPQFGD